MTKAPVSKAPLAMTAADHARIGSTPPSILLKSPRKKLHATMSADQLRAYMGIQMMALTVQRQMALSGEPRQVRAFQSSLVDIFMPNFEYLKEIGRLPEILEGFDPAAMFTLPTNSAGMTTVKIILELQVADEETPALRAIWDGPLLSKGSPFYIKPGGDFDILNAKVGGTEGLCLSKKAESYILMLLKLSRSSNAYFSQNRQKIVAAMLENGWGDWHP